MKRSRDSRYKRDITDAREEYDHHYAQTRTPSRRLQDHSRQYSIDDLRILQDIVNLAVQQSEISADVAGTPGRPNASFHHLHTAYESVLRMNHIEPASDSHFYRFLIKLAAVQGPSWGERFEILVDNMHDDLDNTSTSIQNESEDADADDSSSASTLTRMDKYPRTRRAVQNLTETFLQDMQRTPKKTPKRTPTRTRTRNRQPDLFSPIDRSDDSDISTLPPYTDTDTITVPVPPSSATTATTKAIYLRAWKSFTFESSRSTRNQTYYADTLHATRLLARAISAWREQLRWFYASQTYVAEARENLIRERVFNTWRATLERRRQRSHLILVERQRIERDRMREAERQQQERKRADAKRRQQEQVEEERQQLLRRQEHIERQRHRRERKEREQRERLEQEEEERLQREHLQTEAAHLQALEEQERQRDLARIQGLEHEKQQIETQRRQALLNEQERQEHRRLQLQITAQTELERQRQERKQQQRDYEARIEAARSERLQLDHACLNEAFQVWRLKSREQQWDEAQQLNLKQRCFKFWYLASWNSRSQVLYETKLSRGALREWRTRLAATVERNRNYNVLLRYRQEQTMLEIFKAWRLRLILRDVEIRNDSKRVDTAWAHWRYTFVESRAINQHAHKQLVRNCLITWRNHVIDTRAQEDEAITFFKEKTVLHAFTLWNMMHQHQVRAQQFHDKRIQKDHLHMWLIYQRCQLLERVHWKRILRNVISVWRQDTQHAMNASLRLQEWEQDHEQTEALQLADIFKAWRRKAQVWVNAANYAEKTAASSISHAAFGHWRARLQGVEDADEKVANARNHFVILSALSTWRRKAVESRRLKIQRCVEKFQHVRDRRALQLNFGTWVVATQRQRRLFELERTMENLINVRLGGNAMIKWMQAIDRREQSRTMAIDYDSKRILVAGFNRLVQVAVQRADRARSLKTIAHAFDTWKAKYAYAKVRQQLSSRTFLLAWRAITARRHALTIALDEASRTRYAFRDAMDSPLITIYKFKNMRAHFNAWLARSQNIAHLQARATAFIKGKEENSGRAIQLRLFSTWHLAAVRKATKAKEANEKARLVALASVSEEIQSHTTLNLLISCWTTWRTKTRAIMLSKHTSKHRAMILQSWTRIINEEAALKRQVVQRDALRKWIGKTRRELILQERGREVYEGVVLREGLSVWRFHLTTRLRERDAKTFDGTLQLGRFFGNWRQSAKRQVALRINKEEQYIKNEDLMRRYQKYRLLRMGLKRWRRQVNARKAERTRRSTRRFAPAPAPMRTAAPVPIERSLPLASIDTARRERLMQLNQRTVDRRTRSQRRG